MYGGQYALLERIKLLELWNHNYLVFLNKNSKIEKELSEINPDKVKALDDNRIVNALKIGSFLRKLHSKKNKIIIHTESFDTAYLLFLVIRIFQLNIQHVFSFRSNRFERLNFIDFFILKRIDVLLTNSEFSRYQIKSQNISVKDVTYTPIDFTEIEFDAKKSYSNDVLVTVCSIERRKNILFLIKAISQYVKEEGRKVKLVIYGESKDTNGELYLKEIMEYIEANEIKFVSFEGYANKKEIFREPKIFVAPFVNEPLGRVVAEAIYAGFKTIVSTSGGLKEASCGYADEYEHNDIDSCVCSIKKAVENESLHYSIAEARKKLSSKFSSANIVAREIMHYEN